MRAYRFVLPLALVAGAFALAGCEQPQAPTQVRADGTVLVAIGPGIRCHQNQCLEFDRFWDRARVPPQDFVAMPAGTRVGDGVLTEAQFRELFERARRAPMGGTGRAGDRS